VLAKLLTGVKGPTSKGREGKRMEKEGKGRNRGERMEGEGNRGAEGSSSTNF